MKTLTIDFETRSGTDLKTRGSMNYMNDADFKIVLVAYKENDGLTKVVDFPSGDFLEKLLSPYIDDGLIIAHNAKFELEALHAYYLKVPTERVRDTMVMCQYYGLPPSLAEASSFLELEHRKLTIGKGLIDTFTKPILPRVKARLKLSEDKMFWEPEDKPEEWEQFRVYAEYDVETTYDIYKALPKVPENIWHEWALNFQINQAGVKVDLAFVRQAVKDLEEEQTAAYEKLEKLTGLENPRSNKQMKDWLAAFCGINTDSLAKAKVEEIIETTDSDFVKKVLTLYSKLTKTSGAKYQRFLDLTDKNGYLYDILNYYGARTGRWSSWGVQLHNMKRIDLPNHVEARELAMAELVPHVYDNVTEIYTNLIRTALIAGDNKKFVVVDFAQIEARVLQWLAQDKEALAVFASGKDFYTYTAANMFKKKFEDIDRDSEERRKGKIATLALGYGGGPRALERSAEGIMSEWEKQELVTLWRQANRKVVAFWTKLNNAFVSAVSTHKTVTIDVGERDKIHVGWTVIGGKNTAYITLPSGRAIYFPDVKPGVNEYTFYGKASDFQFGSNYVNVYGGFLAENVTQAIARDCLQILIERLTDAGIQVAFHVHDEVICEVPEDFDMRFIESIAKLPVYEGLPLASEPGEGKYYDK